MTADHPTDAPPWIAFPGKVPVCRDCGTDWKPVRRGECIHCGSDAGPIGNGPGDVHACPPEGSGVMPCCGRTPFEVPPTDRMTSTETVTCTGESR